jgi:hypothetical protein
VEVSAKTVLQLVNYPIVAHRAGAWVVSTAPPSTSRFCTGRDVRLDVGRCRRG